MKGKINPIQSRSDIDRIRDILKGKPRDLLLFDLATRTGLDIKQILNIRVRDLLGCKIGSRLVSASTGRKTAVFFRRNQNRLSELGEIPEGSHAFSG